MARRQTGRPVSGGSVQISAVGSAVTTSVDLAGRPMSGQGLDGTRAQSGKRKVQDQSYFMTELRTRIQQINKETEALSNSTVELKKRETMVQRLDDSAKELRGRVSDL